VAIWYIFPVLVCGTMKNLATQPGANVIMFKIVSLKMWLKIFYSRYMHIYFSYMRKKLITTWVFKEIGNYFAEKLAQIAQNCYHNNNIELGGGGQCFEMF
jgi:hypothetical protein